MSKSDFGVRNAELDKLIWDLAPEATAIRAALAVEDNALKNAVAAAVEIGERLSAVRARAPHGLWSPWLAAAFSWKGSSTALRYMRLFEMSKSFNLTDLGDRIPRSGLYFLAAPSTPDEVRDEIMRRAQAGECFSCCDVEDMVAEGKAAAAVSRVRVVNTTTEIRPPVVYRLISDPKQTKKDETPPISLASYAKQSRAKGPVLHLTRETAFRHEPGDSQQAFQAALCLLDAMEAFGKGPWTRRR